MIKLYAHNSYSGGSSVTTYSILADGGLEPLQSFTFTLSAPGANPDRQEAPHPHEALIDPTDSFVIVPDLGADLVRIFAIDPSTSLLKESTPFSTHTGSGPRHGAFLVSGDETYFFLISELANTIASYKVTYGTDTLTLEEVFWSGVYGDQPTPAGAAAAEASLSVSQIHSPFQTSIFPAFQDEEWTNTPKSRTINTS
jgi:6-phosphogluconolactonase (cycloisomerase 2 family)